MISAKTAELIEIPFVWVTRVGPRNHVLDGVEIIYSRRYCNRIGIAKLLLKPKPHHAVGFREYRLIDDEEGASNKKEK